MTDLKQQIADLKARLDDAEAQKKVLQQEVGVMEGAISQIAADLPADKRKLYSNWYGNLGHKFEELLRKTAEGTPELEKIVSTLTKNAAVGDKALRRVADIIRQSGQPKKPEEQ